MERSMIFNQFVKFINELALKDRTKLMNCTKNQLIEKSYDIERKNEILRGLEELLLKNELTDITLSRLMKYPHLISNLYMQYLQGDNDRLDKDGVKKLIGSLLNKNISRL